MRAEVVLQESKRSVSYRVLTNAAGVFDFRGVPPGTYDIVSKRIGFIGGAWRQRRPGGPGQPLHLGPEDGRSGIDIRLTPFCVVSGQVRDPFGDPISDMMVTAHQIEYKHGRRVMGGDLWRAVMLTNDRGEYRLSGMPPGRYYLSAFPLNRFLEQVTNLNMFKPSGSDNRAANRQAEIPIFYPGVSDVSQASMLELRAGEERPGVDFVFDFTPLQTITGGLMIEAGCDDNLKVNVDQAIDNSNGSRAEAVRTSGESFEMRGMVPGAWIVSAASQHCSGVTHFEMSAAGAGRPLLHVQHDAVVMGTVFLEAGASPLAKDAKMWAQSFDLKANQSAKVDADGNFKWTLPQGEWSFGLSGGPQDTYIKSASSNGVDVLEGGLNVLSGQLVDLKVKLSNTGSRIQGLVLDRDKEPVNSATVVLVPENRLRKHGRLFSEVETNTSGCFEIRGVDPGEYKIFAWDTIDGEAYRDPEFLRPYERLGQVLVVKEGERRQINLKLIVD